MGSPRCITFDLDDTLFDHRRAQAEALRRAATTVVGGDGGVERFIERFHVHNGDLWDRYRAGDIDGATLRRERFARALADLGVGGDGEAMSAAFLDDYSSLPYLKLGVEETLAALVGRYRIGCVTDGFRSAQHAKLRSTGIGTFFDFVVTSEDVGSAKPSRAIYRAARRAAGCPAVDIVHVGDSFDKDVVGAKLLGFRAAWVPHPADAARPPSDGPEPDWILNDLRELPAALGAASGA